MHETVELAVYEQAGAVDPTDAAIIPVGATVDLLIDASNPVMWVLHCHIAEHLRSA